MTRNELLRFVATLSLGAAVALPVGLWLGGRGETEPARAATRVDASGFRQPYSPTVLRDPHFLAEQRKGVEALEKRCRDVREYCTEAAAARAWLAQHAGN